MSECDGGDNQNFSRWRDVAVFVGAVALFPQSVKKHRPCQRVTGKTGNRDRGSPLANKLDFVGDGGERHQLSLLLWRLSVCLNL
jgi:hypothetical protein